MRTIGTYGASWKEEWGFCETFVGSGKGGKRRRIRMQKKEKGTENFYFKPEAYLEPTQTSMMPKILNPFDTGKIEKLIFKIPIISQTLDINN